MDNILSMANNPYQSYGYVNSYEQTNDLILPSRSSASLGYSLNGNLYQYPFSDPNDQYSTPYWQSTMPYAPATSLPTVYIDSDIPLYVETSMGSSESTMSNDGSDFAFGPFANDDARCNPYFG